MTENKKQLDENIIIDGVDSMFHETYRNPLIDGPWYKIGTSESEKELTDEERLALLKNSRDRYWKTPEGKGLISGAVNYIIGQGIIYKADDENPIVQEKLEEFWKASSNLMELRQKEIIIRTLRDGEVFIRFFEDFDGMSYIRFIEPEQIVKINKNIQDSETVESYYREWTPEDEHEVHTELIPAVDMLHIKLNVDMNMKRGRPYIECIVKRLVQLEQFIEGRSRKNRIAAGHILEKIVKGRGATASAVSSIASGMSNATTDSGVSVSPKKMPKFGSVIVHNEAIEYKWCNPQINADDSKEDGRLIKLSISAGLNAPEFLMGDASNANYSSTLVSENPYVRSIEDLQDTFKVYFGEIFKRVITRLINKKIIPSNSTETSLKEWQVLNWLPKSLRKSKKLREVMRTESVKTIPTKVSVSIEFPPMVHKELKTDTEAYQIHSAMGWADDSTLAAKLGYDYEIEQNKLMHRKKQEEKNHANDHDDQNFEKGREEELENE